MRTASSLVLALTAASLAAACAPASSTRQVSATPPVAPTVTYEVTGNDLTQANGNAIAYCRQYNMGVVSQGIARTASGSNVATYTCTGQLAAGTMNAAPGAVVVAPAQPGVVVAPSQPVIVAPSR